MSLTITPSDVANHPVILSGASTSNVTYTITSTNYTTTGVTYNITGDDADKFIVSYATFANDNTQQATLTLNNATAAIATQILYKINLVATDVADPGITATKAIGIFVSSSETSVSGQSLASITVAADRGADGSKEIPELDTTTKAKFPIRQLNANDELQMEVEKISGSTNFNLDVERISSVNYITLERKTGADGAEHASQQESVNVKLKYSGSGHGNVDGNGGDLADPTYESDHMTLVATYTPVKIKFYSDAALTTELDSGSGTSSATTGEAVATYYNGRASGANTSLTVIADATASRTDKDIPVYLDQKCTWALAGLESADFKIFTASGGTTELPAAGAANCNVQTAWIRLTHTGTTNYATKKSYSTNLTVTDAGGSSAGNNTQTRVLQITVAVSHDTIIPVINDISFNGTAYAGNINTLTWNFDELAAGAAATEVARFKMDHTLHGANDLVTGVDFYLQQTPESGNATSGTATSITVDSITGDSTATFSVTSATATIDGNETKEATVKVVGITFNRNYTAATDNHYKLDIFALDPVDTTITNSSDVRLASDPVTFTVNVKNITPITYQGLTGTDGFIVTNGVVSAGGTTNASIIEFGLITSMPAANYNVFDDAAGGVAPGKKSFTLTGSSGVTDVTDTTLGTFTLSDVSHPVNTNISVKKIVFSIPGTANMISGQTYTLAMPDLLAPATAWQNAASSLSGSTLEGTNARTFLFTYDANSQDIMFHGPDSVEWARGHPYTEIFYASGQTMDNTTTITSAYGANHSGLTGNKMSYYNSVDPTAEDGTVGFFTWTVTNAAGGQSSRTRTVTIKGSVGGTYAGNTVRSPPVLKQDVVHSLTFAGTGSTATQPNALTYAQIKVESSPTRNAADTADIAVTRTTALTLTQRGTLWQYASANGVPANASFDEIYNVNNEDVYAYNFAANNTDVSEKSAEWTANTAGAAVSANANFDYSPHISKSGKSGSEKTNWDSAFAVLNGGSATDITGKRVVTIYENSGTGAGSHNIEIDLAGLNIDQQITAVFSLQASEDFSSTVTDFNEHATCNIKMNKADFNNIFFYKPEDPGITTTGAGTVWSQLITSGSLRSETIDLLQKEENWPVMKSGNAAGTTVGTTHQLHQITASNYKDTPKFEIGVPHSGDAIEDIVVENWTFDLFGVRQMADIFSSTPTMKTEINNYLTSPLGANNTSNPSTFEGAIRNNLAALNSNVAVASRQTGENDTQTQINGKPAQFLLYSLRDKISGTASAHYRLTTAVGGMFHPDNKIVSNGADNGYFPFIWQAGDKITVGTKFTHADVAAGNLFGAAGTTKALGDLPFKFIITLV